jgi:hypothetical protein
MAYICYIAIGFLIGMAVGILGLLVWNSLGAAQMASRQCTLQNLRAELERRAESEGRYPRDLRDVIEELGLGKHVDADDLGYPAAGRAYDLREDDMVLFYERRARRYGFVVGRFEMRQSYFNFRLGVEGQVRRE